MNTHQNEIPHNYVDNKRFEIIFFLKKLYTYPDTFATQLIAIEA